MTAWGTFAGVVGVVLALVLALARLSTAAVFGPDSDPGDETAGSDLAPDSGVATGTDGDTDPDRTAVVDPTADDGTEPGAGPTRTVGAGDSVDAGPERPAGEKPGAGVDPTGPGPAPDAVGGREAGSVPETVDREAPQLSTRALLANVALTQAVFGSLVVGGAVLAAVPPAALGVDVPTVGSVATGAGLGGGLWLASEAGGRVADRLGLDLADSDRLRRALSPDSTGEWALLLGVALPVVAVVEELLFRAALVGALPTGYGVSPWLAVVPASVVFGLGHGAQGRAGIVATGLLGAVLAAAFVLTGSLTVVVVAHYLLNALEFVVHER